MRKLKVAVTIARFARSRLGMQRQSHALRNIVLSLAIVMLAGCAGLNPPASVSEGVCNIVPRAEYEILGKTRNDQRWIDDTIEGEVGGCNFPRPAPRLASWDAGTNSNAPVAQPAPTKKPGFVKRQVQKATTIFRGIKKPKAGSVEPLSSAPLPQRSAAGKFPFDGMPLGVTIENPPPFPPVVVEEAKPPPPPPKPRSPVDELLDGKPPPNARK
jgi:hypothetical protein